MATTSAADEQPRVSKRQIRSTTEVRDLILTAARERFAAMGYAGTTTRQIAARAGVMENRIFKHFGNKATLFEKAVVEPFRKATEEFLERWGTQRGLPHTAEFTAHEFIASLYDLIENQAELLIALMSARRLEAGTDESVEQPLIPLLHELERVGAYELGANGYAGVDLQVVVRCMFSMVVFNAAFADALYVPGVRRPDRDRIVREMTSFFVHGVAHRPPEPS
ncbi:MAG TPA: helix-turn-helix domain-containing protein [Pseudonocardia sp.]